MAEAQLSNATAPSPQRSPSPHARSEINELINCEASETPDPHALTEFSKWFVRNPGCAISKGGLRLWKRGEEGMERH